MNDQAPVFGLEGDNVGYELLAQAVENAKVDGLFVEIGTRLGGSAKVIIDAMVAAGRHGTTLICIDPYGDIEYAHAEGVRMRLDYNNAMRRDTQRNLHAYAHSKPINVQLLILEDTEFFARFADGYPVYGTHKRLINNYAFIFYDGPHDVISIKREIDFFQNRTQIGSVAVFDDIRGYFPHDEVIEPYLLDLGWKLLEKAAPKAAYIRAGRAGQR